MGKMKELYIKLEEEMVRDCIYPWIVEKKMKKVKKRRRVYISKKKPLRE